MTTIVCNVKVNCIRPQYQNLREWCEDPQHVYIARRGVVFVEGERYPKKDSPWANPFKITATATREQVIEKYRVYITDRINTEPEFKRQLETLRGKTLGCWCAPNICHGNVLIELLGE